MSDRSVCRKYAATHRTIPAGQEIYAEGEVCDDIFVIDAGWAIQHQILEDGRRQILSFALPGSILGFQPNPHTPISHSAECLTDVTVTVLPKSRLVDIFRQDSEVALQLATSAIETLDTAFDSLTDIGRRTAKEAVAHLLMRLYRKACDNGMIGGDGCVVFPLTLEHIGDALGLTGVHVCRTLKVLREEGIAEFARGRLEILDPRRLAEVAGTVASGINIPDRYPAGHPHRRTEKPIPASSYRDSLRMHAVAG